MKSTVCLLVAVPARKAAFFLGCLMVGIACAWAESPVAPRVPVAEQLTRRAVDAGLQGDLQGRIDLLSRAIGVDPDYAPARWEAEQISIDGQWLPLDKAQAEAAGDPRLERYLAARRTTTDDAAGHQQLARWCRRNRLTDEARYHWLRVLSEDAQNQEALQALDSTWHHGRLLPNDVARDLQESERDQCRANRTWRAQIAKWERSLAGEPTETVAALEELRSTVDASAIPEFERLAAGKEHVTASVASRRERLSFEFIDALGAMPGFPATESLCRYTALAPEKTLRDAAGKKLVDRPRHEVMPVLLAALASPIESHFDLSVSPLGNVSYSHEFFAKGPDADQVIQQAHNEFFRVDLPPARLSDDFTRRANQMARAEQRLRGESRGALQQLSRQAYQVEQQVAAENARRHATNERIINALREIVGEDLGDDPVAWWDYWREYNEYERPPYRPTEYHRRYHERHTRVRPPGMSCFVAGTPVWTRTGLAPIESLSPGDLVLSQDLATGEYRFRPVLTTTTRTASPTLEIAVHGQSVQTTLGHPFWLPGVGWRMAKELKAGDKLLAVAQPVEIETIAEAGDQVAFNLVVEGAGNYFVGQDGLLVHDNTPRRPELVRLQEQSRLPR
ncbi:MAG: hypothetical protein KDA37_03560 [Planctomycetales bacterium]|nr:hypothetical protein [Planctomycetales bacterium]